MLVSMKTFWTSRRFSNHVLCTGGVGIAAPAAYSMFACEVERSLGICSHGPVYRTLSVNCPDCRMRTQHCDMVYTRPDGEQPQCGRAAGYAYRVYERGTEERKVGHYGVLRIRGVFRLELGCFYVQHLS